MTILVENLKREVDLLNGAGTLALSSISSETLALLDELRNLETSLVAEIASGSDHLPTGQTDLSHTTRGPELQRNNHTSLITAKAVELVSNKWYALSISSLKSYNHQITKYVKNIATSPKYQMDLDSAYAFPLLLDSHPSQKFLETLPNAGNRQELMKSIIMHLLKLGHSSAVADLVRDSGMENQLNQDMASEFSQLHGILDEIKKNHLLDSALKWLQAQSPGPHSRMEQLLLKVHLIQFFQHLTCDTDPTHFKAYLYSKAHFPRYFKDHLREIAPHMALLLYNPRPDASQVNKAFHQQIVEGFFRDSQNKLPPSRLNKFLADILQDFDRLDLRQDLFNTVAHEFVIEFCAKMGLSGDSALFECVLAGFVNLPNFHKYSQLQTRLGRQVDTLPVELPFQLPDKNHFLFRHHPIFICPVLKEQLVPLTSRAVASDEEMRDRKRRAVLVSSTEKLVPMANPVVVFDHCRHLALKDSVRSLTKGGTEVFKCHYCYKRHKLQEVSDAYFIDL